MILSDISRCRGVPKEKACKKCARRLQLDMDNTSRWYPMMHTEPINGKCEYQIIATKDGKSRGEPRTKS